MKLTLTHTELTKLVIDVYHLPLNTVLEISGYAGIDTDQSKALHSALTAADCLTPLDNIRPEKKIAAIKILRDLVIRECKFNVVSGQDVCSLVQAKTAIEDWDRFFTYVRKNGYPSMSSGIGYRWQQ